MKKIAILLLAIGVLLLSSVALYTSLKGSGSPTPAIEIIEE